MAHDNDNRIDEAEIDLIDVEGVLKRIEECLAEMGIQQRRRRRISDMEAQDAAGTPGIISNLRSALKTKKRKGINSTTLERLSRYLGVRPQWLLKNEGNKRMEGTDVERVVERMASMSENETVELLSWCFEFRERAKEEVAIVAARGVLGAYRMHRSVSGEPLDIQRRKEYVQIAIELFLPPKPSPESF